MPTDDALLDYLSRMQEAPVYRSEHDRVVAELRAEIAELRSRVQELEASRADT